MESVSDNWFRRTDSRLIFLILELNAAAKSTICPAQQQYLCGADCGVRKIVSIHFQFLVCLSLRGFF